LADEAVLACAVAGTAVSWNCVRVVAVFCRIDDAVAAARGGFRTANAGLAGADKSILDQTTNAAAIAGFEVEVVALFRALNATVSASGLDDRHLSTCRRHRVAGPAFLNQTKRRAAVSPERVAIVALLSLVDLGVSTRTCRRRELGIGVGAAGDGKEQESEGGVTQHRIHSG
jgi:hypothetical protein